MANEYKDHDKSVLNALPSPSHYFLVDNLFEFHFPKRNGNMEDGRGKRFLKTGFFFKWTNQIVYSFRINQS